MYLKCKYRQSVTGRRSHVKDVHQQKLYSIVSKILILSSFIIYVYNINIYIVTLYKNKGIENI